ncbi:hypothetical protein, partial [Rhodococcus sp. UYP9]|uniref:hypothetical protein n=1 Tax=Rhodococcus sp. UYP9 TaxID=1756407 RepID=UPI003394ADB6
VFGTPACNSTKLTSPTVAPRTDIGWAGFAKLQLRRNQTRQQCVEVSVEDSAEYRQALIDEGYDPDDPHLRKAIAGVVALLRKVAADEQRFDVERSI